MLALVCAPFQGELVLSDKNHEWETLGDALNVLEDLLKMNKAGPELHDQACNSND